MGRRAGPGPVARRSFWFRFDPTAVGHVATGRQGECAAPETVSQEWPAFEPGKPWLPLVEARLHVCSSGSVVGGRKRPAFAGMNIAQGRNVDGNRFFCKRIERPRKSLTRS